MPRSLWPFPKLKPQPVFDYWQLQLVLLGVAVAIWGMFWLLKTALDELKTHLRGAQIVLRSKTPELVEQEFWGLLLAHYAIRGLMHEAALKADEDPDRLSCLHSVRVVQRRMARFAAIPPSAQASPA